MNIKSNNHNVEIKITKDMEERFIENQSKGIDVFASTLYAYVIYERKSES